MNSDKLFTSTINDYLGMDHTGAKLNTLADNFYRASLDLLQEIARAMDDNHHTAWRAHLHTLKGIAGIAGAKNLHDLCDTLRARHTTTFTDTPERIMMQLRDEIDNYLDAIRQTLNSTLENRINSR